MFCDVIEDEDHAMFRCKAYNNIRKDYQILLNENPSLKNILNPKTKETAYKVGLLLKQIEAERKLLIKGGGLS